ncbi:MAG: PqqD family protein [Gemmatimonadaceae bacterium]|nr:PqqD family protein [Gemmatimonadaceae bacterium]NUQ94777.1 PqqD family protein [Gemmatimonadaceae bacterium]NUR34015.1 PqqD family protein [Gemmatimonadaceae bacterium]NUS99250.1 PqqD family protein [Gemmatimonadaceae bacterium]
MPTSTETRPRRNPRVLTQRAGELVVLLDPDSGEYFSLDDVGGRIWELCDGTRTIGEIAVAIGEEYDADPAAIEADAAELLAGLGEASLLGAGA